MSLTPISSNMPAPREPERSRAEKKAAERTDAAPRNTEAVKTRGLVADMGARMAELQESKERGQERVAGALDEIRSGELLRRDNLEKAAEAMLYGQNAEDVDLE